MHHLKPFAIVVLNGEITMYSVDSPNGFEWYLVGQLIQNLVWIFPNGSTANTKPCLDTSKWWINGPSKTIWMDLNGSTACCQHCSNGITMCVQNCKVEILNGFKWSISRRVKDYMISLNNTKCCRKLHGGNIKVKTTKLVSRICALYKNRVWLHLICLWHVELWRTVQNPCEQWQLEDLEFVHGYRGMSSDWPYLWGYCKGIQNEIQDQPNVMLLT